jgi:hypothetical protein
MFQHEELTDLAKSCHIAGPRSTRIRADVGANRTDREDILRSTSLAKVLDKDRKYGDFLPDRTRFLGRTADAGRDIAMRPL